MAKATDKVKPSEIAVCIEGFGFQAPDGPRAFQRGARVRGDAPIMKSHPQFFAADGLSDDEIQRLRVERGLQY